METMEISTLQEESWRIAEDKGFHEARDSNTAIALSLIHSEVSEALEADRSGWDDVELAGDLHYQAGKAETEGEEELAELLEEAGEEIMPDTIGEELADIMIRVADLAEEENVDLQQEVEKKMSINEDREEMHGGKNY